MHAMKGKLLYGILLLALVLYSTWQWVRFDLPVLHHPVVPPVLPAQVKGDVQLTDLLEHNLWDKKRGTLKHNADANLALKNAAVLTWALRGIGYQQMYSPVAVIASGGDVKQYSEGDVLPDKALLLQVMERRILVEKDGKEKYVYLFKKK